MAGKKSGDLEREQTGEVLAAIERERDRLAQALHDTVCQSVSGMQMLAHVLQRKVSQKAPEAAGEIAELAGLIQGITGELQQLVYWLRPSALEQTGLCFALSELCDQVSGPVRCEVDCAPDLVLPNDVAAQLYHIAQTALIHALPRPGLTSIRISVVEETAGVTLQIEDDAANSAPPASGSAERLFGWELLERRAAFVGAKLHQEHGEDQGNIVSCNWPRPAKTRSRSRKT